MLINVFNIFLDQSYLNCWINRLCESSYKWMRRKELCPKIIAAPQTSGFIFKWNYRRKKQIKMNETKDGEFNVLCKVIEFSMNSLNSKISFFPFDNNLNRQWINRNSIEFRSYCERTVEHTNIHWMKQFKQLVSDLNIQFLFCTNLIMFFIWKFDRDWQISNDVDFSHRFQHYGCIIGKC